MRRVPLAAFTLATMLVAMVPTSTLGAKPSVSCPAASSGYFVVDRQARWDITVAGFEAEGIDVYEADGVTFTAEFDEFAEAIGFGNGQGLYEFVWFTQWAVIDKNENDLGLHEIPTHHTRQPRVLLQRRRRSGVDQEGRIGLTYNHPKSPCTNGAPR